MYEKSWYTPAYLLKETMVPTPEDTCLFSINECDGIGDHIPVFTDFDACRSYVRKLRKAHKDDYIIVREFLDMESIRDEAFEVFERFTPKIILKDD